MSFINLNTMHVIKVLTLAMSLGSLHPSCASEVPKTQESVSMVSSSIQAVDKLDNQIDQFIEKRVRELKAENNLEVNQRIEAELLNDINKLQSNYSLADNAAVPLILAVTGTAFFFCSGNPLLTSFTISTGYGVYRFLISQYHHYRILHSLNTALTSTREEKIQLEFEIASWNDAKERIV